MYRMKSWGLLMLVSEKLTETHWHTTWLTPSQRTTEHAVRLQVIWALGAHHSPDLVILPVSSKTTRYSNHGGNGFGLEQQRTVRTDSWFYHWALNPTALESFWVSFHPCFGRQRVFSTKDHNYKVSYSRLISSPNKHRTAEKQHE